MRKDLSQLLHLQSIDLRVRGLGKDKEIRSSDLESREEKIKAMEKSREEEKERLRGEEVRIKTLELQVAEKTGQIEKYQQQLLKVKNNKEYQALLHETEGVKGDIRVLEDEILEIMEEAEVAKGKLQGIDSELEGARKGYQVATAEARQEFEQIDQELEEVKAQREQVASSLEVELLEKYERIFSHKLDRAVVPVVGKTCQGCNMQLTGQVLNDLQKDEMIHYCENCGRLIYLPEK